MAEDIQLSDAQLIDQTRHGDEQAMSCLMQRYKAAVEATASRNAGSSLEREDLIQEGLMGLLSGIYAYDASREAAPRTFLQVCIAIRIQSALRHSRRVRIVPAEHLVPFDEQYLGDSLPAQRGPEDQYIDKEETDTLYRLVDEHLSPFENEVLRLHIVGCSYGEMAQRLNKPVKAVDNAMQRIRNKLNGLVSQ
ncbi:MAG: sigma-70 family RNA polymerase sigma factor [Clostridiales bacterium]|nr:sigma-70 family RNA polymerase sigma factor [Clostridiales bacterium]